jgi:hypothetical protein
LPLRRRIHIGERSLFRRRSPLDVYNLPIPDPQDVTASVIGVAPLLCFARGPGV